MPRRSSDPRAWGNRYKRTLSLRTADGVIRSMTIEELAVMLWANQAFLVIQLPSTEGLTWSLLTPEGELRLPLC